MLKCVSSPYPSGFDNAIHVFHFSFLVVFFVRRVYVIDDIIRIFIILIRRTHIVYCICTAPIHIVFCATIHAGGIQTDNSSLRSFLRGRINLEAAAGKQKNRGKKTGKQKKKHVTINVLSSGSFSYYIPKAFVRVSIIIIIILVRDWNTCCSGLRSGRSSSVAVVRQSWKEYRRGKCFFDSSWKQLTI